MLKAKAVSATARRERCMVCFLFVCVGRGEGLEAMWCRGARGVGVGCVCVCVWCVLGGGGGWR